MIVCSSYNKGTTGVYNKIVKTHEYNIEQKRPGIKYIQDFLICTECKKEKKIYDVRHL